MRARTDWGTYVEDGPQSSKPRAVTILEEVIDAIRLVGVLLAVGGVLVSGRIANLRMLFDPKLALVTGLVTIPGVLYLVAAAGLVKRRYWAWVMSLAVTVLLIVALIAAFAVVAWRDAKMRSFVVPGALYVSMPGLILAYMVRALPVVREAELLGTKGFNVLMGTSPRPRAAKGPVTEVTGP
jgi:hypothetical protein